ncbi:uncharacterized protein G2W53_041458 [Senna tora]|uniref:Uncharacterized protein n=1 Tax=Senna tora TaxID=362788 RepID=A0A834SFK1_9FABA|nr:uncharacterized protein G2W53_041458 [Senna tora]
MRKGNADTKDSINIRRSISFEELELCSLLLTFQPVKASKIRCFWINCSDCTPVSKS